MKVGSVLEGEGGAEDDGGVGELEVQLEERGPRLQLIICDVLADAGLVLVVAAGLRGLWLFGSQVKGQSVDVVHFYHVLGLSHVVTVPDYGAVRI